MYFYSKKYNKNKSERGLSSTTVDYTTDDFDNKKKIFNDWNKNH